MTFKTGLLPALLLLLPQQALCSDTAAMNRQIATIRAIDNVALSPDGKETVSVIADPTVAGGHAHLWILSRNRQPRQITGTRPDIESDDSSPVWSADGRAVLFVEKQAQGGAVRQVDPLGGTMRVLSLASDGKTVTAGWGTAPHGRMLDAKGFALAESGALAVWAAAPPPHRAGKADEHLVGQTEPVRLYLIALDGTVREVVLPDNIRSAVWSADSERLLVITSPASDDLGQQNRLWLVEDGQPPRQIRGTAENVQAVSWLPGNRIAYFARCQSDAPIVCRDLFVQALDGSPARDLTAGIHGSVIAGMENAAKAGPVITSSGEILITIARSFEQHLVRVDPESGRMTTIKGLPPVVKSLSSNARGTGFALLAADKGDAVKALIADARLRSAAPLQTPALQPEDWKPLVATKLEWASDRFRIDGLLYMPQDASPAAPVPLVVDVHGGPAGRFEDVDYPLVRLLINQGYAVLHVNPRGSFGYGTQFLAALKDDLGGGDYRDIMNGVDAALKSGSIDRGKMALIGYSYGGTMAGFALGRTDRFKVLVAAAPVVDQFSEYGNEDSSWYDRWYFGKPWRRFEAAWRQSPLSGVAQARTPLLLLQGESDTIDPPGQSMELYRALRQEGLSVELMLFPRESHHELGKNFYGFPSVEPSHGIVLRQRILDVLRAAFSGQSDAGLRWVE